MPKEKKIQVEKRKKMRASELNRVTVSFSERVHNKQPRIQYGYENVPSRAEQHGWQDTDINYLMKRYSPDELSNYIASRNQHRIEILDHDFSKEPNLQEAKNIVVELNRQYDSLPEELKRMFNGPLEFLKYVDNPENREKLIKLGLIKEKEVAKLQDKLDDNPGAKKSTENQDPPKQQRSNDDEKAGEKK